MSAIGQVNAVLFEHLFMQIIFTVTEHQERIATQQQHPSDPNRSNQPDNEIIFYRIEKLGFTVGQSLIDRYFKIPIK